MLYAGSFLTVFALTMGLGYTMARDRISIVQRLEHYTEDEKETVYQELAEPLSERVFKPLWNRLMSNIKRAIPQEKAVTYEQKLTLAGYPHGLDAETFVVVKYTVLAVMILGGLFSRSFLMLLILGTLGIIMPDIYLNLCCNRRKDRITRSLPDTLDLLSVSVEAGLGFDAALQKVVEKSEGPLADEFSEALNEIKMGKPRREALKDMAARMEVDDVSTFVGAIVQADTLGVSITNVLRIQAEQVREKRKQRAEEKAQKAPVKMLIPILLFIFPTIFIVLLGPAMIRIGEMFAK
jgi:tight adherence protein C